MKKSPLLLLLLACIFTSPSALGQALPPNILVILADDLGYGDVGFNGCLDIPTPNMDALAAAGALCTNGYVTHPFCSPSRAGLITGRNQQRFGYETQPTADDTNPRLGLPEQEFSMAELLKPAGYATSAIGKWHLGQALNLHPNSRGFDEFFGVLGGRAFPGYYNASVLRDETPLIESQYLTDAFTREGVSFIKRHATEPFFLYLAYTAPHAPYDVPPQKYMNRVKGITDPARRIYAAMVVALDDGVGKVVQTLQANNLLDNTLIFLLSDNGAPNTGGFTSNYPLRGWKNDTLEGGIRIPFAVQWTGRLPVNTVYDDPVSSLDIVASAAAAAGVTLPTDRVYDGLNIIPYLAGEQVAPPRTLFWRWFGLGPGAPIGAQRYTIWAVRSGPLKLVAERAKASQPPALYDLPNDIHEDNDLASAQPQDVAALQNLYNQWTLNTIAPLWQLSTRFRGLPLILAGDWNGFNIDDSSPPWGMTRILAPAVDGTPDGFNWFTTAVYAAATGGDTTPGEHSFVLVGANTYHQQWGGVTVNVDDATTLPFYRGDSLGPTNSITFDDGFYYSFRFLDPIDYVPVDLTLGVMKTSAPPVSASRSGQIPAIPMPGDPITVSIATSEPKSPEEQIYLRWTTDTFITSQLIPVTGSGLSYSATIPGQPDGTLVQNSIITSTADLTPYSTSGAIDSLILATTGTFNAVPTLPTPTPIPTRLNHHE